MSKELMAIIGQWMDIFGEAIYEGKPHPSKSIGRNFVLKGDKCLYIFAFNLAANGHENVTVAGNYKGAYAFSGINENIEKIEWMDNKEIIEFSQKDDAIMVNLTGMPYGTSYCVRVAKADIE